VEEVFSPFLCTQKKAKKSFTLKIQLELDINLCAETGAKQAKAVRRVRVGTGKS
jgi:hypothetical protein